MRRPLVITVVLAGCVAGCSWLLGVDGDPVVVEAPADDAATADEDASPGVDATAVEDAAEAGDAADADESDGEPDE